MARLIRSLFSCFVLFLATTLNGCGGNGIATGPSSITPAVSSRFQPACTEPQGTISSTSRISPNCDCVPENGNDCGDNGPDSPTAPGTCVQSGTCGPCGGDVCVSASSSGSTYTCDPVTCGPSGYSNPPYHGVAIPSAHHIPTPYQNSSIFWALVQAKVPYTIITSAAANQVVANKYGDPAAEESFGGGRAFQVAWQSAYNTILNGTTSPSIETLAANPNTLVRFSTTAANAQTGYWWTAIGSVVDDEGNLLSAQQVQLILALPQTPQYMAIGGQIPAGSTVIYGQAASNAFGSGGAWQLLTEDIASAAGEVIQIAGESGLASRRAEAASGRIIPLSQISTPL